MTILIVNSGAQGDASVSSRLTLAFAERIRALDRHARVNVRDVGAQPVPHLVAQTVAGVRAVARTEAEQQASALSQQLIDEVREADLIVLGVPMYNFGIPSTLKAWFDHLLRPRVTFRYGEHGPEGLLTGKRAIVLITRGGVYSEGAAVAMDNQEPHLRTMLAFVGITDLRFVRAEGLGLGPEAAQQAIDRAAEELAGIAEDQRRVAA